MSWIVVMEEDDKGCPMIRMGVSGRVFLLVPADPGCPGPKAVKRLSVCVCVCVCVLNGCPIARRRRVCDSAFCVGDGRDQRTNNSSSDKATCTGRNVRVATARAVPTYQKLLKWANF